MKTPREILLHRHEAAEEKLNHIRRAAIAQMVKPSVPQVESLPLRALLTLWRELIWPCRRTWAGLAAVWLVLLTLQLASRDPAEVAARTTPRTSPEVLMVLRQQQLLLAELVERSESRAADKPKTVPPRPRSQGRDEMWKA
jgi:hypothetical protein